MDKQIKLFLEFLKNDKKLSDNTLQSYRRDILQFEKYIEQNDINYLTKKVNTYNETSMKVSQMFKDIN